MTAEIAILNKMAVALAADSAVTISAGSKEEKIYDSADKLFELSHKNPIGIMIYNGMQFMQAPLPMLITKFRSSCGEFATVKEAAHCFLDYLNEFGKKSTDRTIEDAISQIIVPVILRLNDRAQKHFQDLFEKKPFPDDISKALTDINDRALKLFEHIFADLQEAKFIGGKRPGFSKERTSIIRGIVDEYLELPPGGGNYTDRVVKICKLALIKSSLSPHRTGIIFAGFGTGELFPTLISFEIDGMVFGNLKYKETNHIDIDRDGDRARVVPFAQKEMVERFLYGLDQQIENNIAAFCKDAVTEIKNEILDQLDMPEADKQSLRLKARAAEDAFVEQLQSAAFEKIRSGSKSAIEDMVEFMPKPELATMAEGLVNLTSIKRRFSRGMETVGGPIDVAIISQSEGFIWVKRKHYFEAELNPRYLQRVNGSGYNNGRVGDGRESKS